ncbi:MAG: DUF3568 domain-containing protein [Planctomycetes bacterium]|nr:DUF3568 domain-containing protein [Planctomycetota bacterium]
MIDAAPDKVTNAAQKAVEQMKLTDVASTGTKIDGRVTARNAQNDLVQIDIAQAGENVSKVSVRVGTTGDDAVSERIVAKTKDNLHWFGKSEENSAQMKNSFGTYSAMVNGAPDKVTTAARKSVEDLKLTDISSTGTGVDGKVTAMTAQNEAVTIDITRAGDNVSKVSIRVSATGDEAVSRQIMNGIKGNL